MNEKYYIRIEEIKKIEEETNSLWKTKKFINNYVDLEIESEEDYSRIIEQLNNNFPLIRYNSKGDYIMTNKIIRIIKEEE